MHGDEDMLRRRLTVKRSREEAWQKFWARNIISIFYCRPMYTEWPNSQYTFQHTISLEPFKIKWNAFHIKSVSLYLERFQRYGVLKCTTFWATLLTVQKSTGIKKSVSEGGESNITGQCRKMKSSSVGCLPVLGARWISAWSYQRVTIVASLRCCWDPSCQRALWTRLTRWQTSRRANLNTTAWWPFISLGRYSRQPISCFLRWHSSHRRW